MSDIYPMDQFNEKLINNVHPRDYQNPQPKDKYSLVVIGGGTAGLVTAAGAAGLGASVALVERRFMGGDCLNYGCVPSKSIIAASRENKIACQKRQTADPEAFEKAMEKMRNNRARISDNDSVKRFNELGVDVFLGDAKFTSKNSVAVAGQQLNFTKAVIATGGRPRDLELPGLERDDYYTNESIFNMTEKPEKMAVIGAGPIGCELAQAFHNLGVEVTILQREDQILPREDRDAAEIVYQQLLADGVNIELGTDLKKMDKRDGKKYLVYEKEGKKETKGFDAILVGIGRVPNIENLGLKEAGVETSRHGVIVNDKLQTTNKKIFAAGDCCMTYKFTHTADAAARIVISNALFLGKQKLSSLTIPWSTYTEPEIAHVGLYSHDAEEKGIAIDTYEQSFAHVDRAITDGEESGLIKVHTKKGSDIILGATIVAANAGDMISEITTAMVGGIGLKTLSGVIHPYPTQAEAIKKIADAYNRTRLTPFAAKLLKFILKFTG